MFLDENYNHCGMRKVYSCVSYNDGIEILKAVGITLEYVLKSEVLIGDMYYDIYRMSFFTPKQIINTFILFYLLCQYKF